jgi:cytochrome c oxidase subunit 2
MTALFRFVLVLSAVVFVLVAGVLLFVIVRHRARPGEADPNQIHGNRRLEVAWTLAAFLLLAIIFVPTLQTMTTVEAQTASGMRVEVIGHQWWWEYRYPDLGVVTANEMLLPVGQPARIELQSADVIHSFWVPRFGWKRDTIPGKTNLLAATVEQAGTYDGTCTEFCGLQHAWMRIRVVAQPPSDFNSWVAAQLRPARTPQTDQERRGAQLFQQSTCSQCHTIRGTSAVAQVGPDLTHVGSRSTLGSGVLDNSEANLARFVKNAQAIKPGVLMPSFESFSDDEIAALAAYLFGLK